MYKKLLALMDSICESKNKVVTLAESSQIQLNPKVIKLQNSIEELIINLKVIFDEK